VIAEEPLTLIPCGLGVVRVDGQKSVKMIANLIAAPGIRAQISLANDTFRARFLEHGFSAGCAGSEEERSEVRSVKFAVTRDGHVFHHLAERSFNTFLQRFIRLTGEKLSAGASVFRVVAWWGILVPTAPAAFARATVRSAIMCDSSRRF
jgi:hypothetical protein